MVVMTLLTLLASAMAVYTGQRWHASINQAKRIEQNISAQRARFQAVQKQPAPPTPQPVRTLLINYDNFGFMPNIARVPIGTIIEVENTTNEGGMYFEEIPQAAKQDQAFNLGIIEMGQIKSFKLTQAGTWIYENAWETTDRGQVTAG